MQLDPHSWHARWYVWWWEDKSLPSDLCTYVWIFLGRSVVRILPLSFVSILICIFLSEIYLFPVRFLFFVGFIACCWIILTAVIGTCHSASRLEIWTITKAFVHGWKNKYCPGITWGTKDNDQG